MEKGVCISTDTAVGSGRNVDSRKPRNRNAQSKLAFCVAVARKLRRSQNLLLKHKARARTLREGFGFVGGAAGTAGSQ